MKKLIFIVIILILFAYKNSYAAYFEAGNYLEKNQWGALEDLLSDCKTGKLTTDECALYGCYVLAAQEPTRADKNDKAKLIPSKYKLDKRSAEQEPYFFIYFIYENKNCLNKSTIEEFENSDWSDSSFWSDFKNNIKLIDIINKTPFETSRHNYNKFRNIHKIIKKILDEEVISSESCYVVFYEYRFNYSMGKIFDKHSLFFEQYKISQQGSVSQNNATTILLINRMQNKMSRKCSQIIQL